MTSTTYVCNGAPGADLNRVDVTATSTQATANTGYVADNDALVTITLPAMAGVGDIVRISGAGAGGWRVAQNAGQRIQAGFEHADCSSLRAATSWRSVASSTAGDRLVAGGYDLELAVDGGASWSASTAPTGGWYGLASSVDGTLVAGLVNNTVALSADSSTCDRLRRHDLGALTTAAPRPARRRAGARTLRPRAPRGRRGGSADRGGRS